MFYVRPLSSSQCFPWIWRSYNSCESSDTAAYPGLFAAPRDGDLVELGVFGAPHGLRGEVRLSLITDAPEQRLGAPGRLWVRRRSGWSAQRGRAPPQPVRLSQICVVHFCDACCLKCVIAQYSGSISQLQVKQTCFGQCSHATL